MSGPGARLFATVASEPTGHPDLSALGVILDECAESDALTPAERAIARDAERWLARVL